MSPISYTAQKPHRDTIEALASVGLDEVTSENLIRLYGKGAHRVIVNLIDGAIDRNQSDEALKLDHVRRELAQALGD